MAIHFSRLPGMDGNGDFQALFIRKDLGFPSSNWNVAIYFNGWLLQFPGFCFPNLNHSDITARVTWLNMKTIRFLLGSILVARKWRLREVPGTLKIETKIQCLHFKSTKSQSWWSKYMVWKGKYDTNPSKTHDFFPRAFKITSNSYLFGYFLHQLWVLPSFVWSPKKMMMKRWIFLVPETTHF